MRKLIIHYYRRWIKTRERIRELEGHMVELKQQREVQGPDLPGFLEQVESNYRDLTNPYEAYCRLIDRLYDMPRVKLLPLYEFAQAHDDQSILIGLRHDIDADPITAIRMARYLARFGICGSFYLLHTALYYGTYDRNTLIRNPEIVRWVKAMIVAGCEIGLHNDALGVYTNYGLDGALALERELAYLRSLGAVIRGTVGHNSIPVYGAENAEIFATRKLWKRTANAPGLVLDRLGVLDEKTMELSYEGTFSKAKKDCNPHEAEVFAEGLENAAIRSESWMRRYLVENPTLDWEPDVQIWVIGRDEWVIGGKQGEKTIWEWMVSLDSMLQTIEQFPPGLRCLLVLHPEYFQG